MLPFALIGVLALLVVYMSGKGGVPNANNAPGGESAGGVAAQLPGPNDTIAVVGNSSPVSPAMSGGSSSLNQTNMVAETAFSGDTVQRGNLAYGTQARRLAMVQGADLPGAVGQNNQQSTNLPTAKTFAPVEMGEAPTFASKRTGTRL